MRKRGRTANWRKSEVLVPARSVLTVLGYSGVWDLLLARSAHPDASTDSKNTKMNIPTSRSQSPISWDRNRWKFIVGPALVIVKNEFCMNCQKI